jgi:hypothetical protein
MLQGLSASYAKELKDIAVMPVIGWSVDLVKSSSYVCIITKSPTSVYLRCWLVKPFTSYDEYKRVEALINGYPTRGKKLYASFANFSFE